MPLSKLLRVGFALDVRSGLDDGLYFAPLAPAVEDDATGEEGAFVDGPGAVVVFAGGLLCHVLRIYSIV